MREHSKTFATGMRPVRQRLGAIACALVSVLLASFMAGCSGSSTPAATVSTFTATSGSSSGSAITITSGASVTLSWSVANATTVTINGTTVTGTSITVSPTTTTTYNLVATNSKGKSVTASVTVTVDAAAVISSFTVAYNGTPSTSATAITSGTSESATLTWTTTGASTVTLNGGTPTTATNSSTTVTPSQTTVYTLVATNAAGTSTSKTVTVNVEALPVISGFTTTPTSLTYGSSFTFSGTCDYNATVSPSVYVENSLYLLVNGSLNGPIQITPTATTTYTATCVNDAGDVTTASTTVKVLPSVSLSAASSNVTTGGSGTTLSWTTHDATTVLLYSYLTASGSSTAVSTDVTSYTSNGTGSYSIDPAANTSYYLVAENTDGSTNSLTIPITVSGAIQDIASFGAYQTSTASSVAVASTSAGGTVYLIPVFANQNTAASSSVDTATIVDNLGNSVTSSAVSGTAYPVSPTATTTYTLTVTNGSYSPTRTQVMNLRVIVGNISDFSGQGLVYSNTGSHLPFTASTASASIFEYPTQMAPVPDGSGNMDFIDQMACVIGGVDKNGNAALIAGEVNTCDTLGTSWTNQPVGTTKFGMYLAGIATDASGDIYVADYSQHLVHKISNGVVNTIAGSYYNNTDVDGNGANAGFSQVYPIRGLVLDSQGEVIIAEARTIRVIDSSNTVTTIAGSTSTGSITDGYGLVGGNTPTAYLRLVKGIAIDKTTDTIYLTDRYSIRKMVPNKTNDTASCHAACWTWQVTTLNSTTATSAYLDGPIATAQFFNPYGLALGSDGTLYVTDLHYLRRISTDGMVDSIAGSTTTACAAGTMCTLPNSNYPNPEPLPGITNSNNIAIDPTQNRLFFTNTDVTSIFTMPY